LKGSELIPPFQNILRLRTFLICRGVPRKMQPHVRITTTSTIKDALDFDSFLQERYECGYVVMR
jgi:hypothetical protein